MRYHLIEVIRELHNEFEYVRLHAAKDRFDE